MSDTQRGESSGIQFMLWAASTRDRFDYENGPYPDQQAAMAAGAAEARKPLNWSDEPNSSAITADTHGWMYRVYPTRETEPPYFEAAEAEKL